MSDITRERLINVAAAAVADSIGDHGDRYAAEYILDAILDALRTEVTTAEELDALPVGTKLLTSRTGHIWWATGRERPAIEGSGGTYSYIDDFFRLEGPAVVIYRPATEETR